MDNKLLVVLNDIGAQQAIATESTNEAISHLLYYMVTYTNNIFVYRASSMVLAAHSDAVFHNESKCRSQS